MCLLMQRRILMSHVGLGMEGLTLLFLLFGSSRCLLAVLTLHSPSCLNSNLNGEKYVFIVFQVGAFKMQIVAAVSKWYSFSRKLR